MNMSGSDELRGQNQWYLVLRNYRNKYKYDIYYLQMKCV